MRVCELILAPAFGGAETLALDLAVSLRERGHEVDVIAVDPASGPRPDGNGEIVVPSRPGWARGQRLGRLAGVHQHLRRGGYDIVLAHTFLPNLYARAAVALGRLHVPVVVALHSGSDDFARAPTRAIERLLLPRTSAVVTVNEKLLAQYRAYFSSATNRLHVIPNGVLKPPFEASQAATAPKAFAVVGRLARVKDIETAIRGFASFLQLVDDPEVHMRIIGPDTEPEYASELRSLARSINPGAITFEGAQRQPFNSYPIDVLIHSASYEAHSLVLLEAAARGIPVVCSSSVADAVDWHCTTFTPGSPDELAQALIRVRSEWPEAVQAARQAWETVPAFTDTARSYELLLHAVIGAGEPESPRLRPDQR